MKREEKISQSMQGNKNAAKPTSRNQQLDKVRVSQVEKEYIKQGFELSGQKSFARWVRETLLNEAEKLIDAQAEKEGIPAHIYPLKKLILEMYDKKS